MNRALGAVTKLAIPAAVGFSLLQASLYDVKGGNRAVIFDRLAGVKDEVCDAFCVPCPPLHCGELTLNYPHPVFSVGEAWVTSEALAK